MPIIDVILVVTLSGFVFYGLFFGFIRTLGLFVGVIVAAVIASRFYLDVYGWVGGFFFGYDNLGKIAVFLVMFSLISKLVSLGFYLLNKSIGLISILPFLKTFNRLGGLLLGLAAGSLAIGSVLYLSSRYAFVGHWFGNTLSVSILAPYFLKFTGLILPFLPAVLKSIKGVL